MTYDKQYLYFHVSGYANFRISKEPNCKCGQTEGFSFESSEYDDDNYVGGVISTEDAVAFAKHILEVTK